MTRFEKVILVSSVSQVNYIVKSLSFASIYLVVKYFFSLCEGMSGLLHTHFIKFKLSFTNIFFLVYTSVFLTNLLIVFIRKSDM